MSHVDSSDEVAKEVYSIDVKTDDSEESKPPKEDYIKKRNKSDEFNVYEASDDDNEDDRDW